MHLWETVVDEETTQKLLTINRQFYERFARSFADARSALQPSLVRALARVADGDAVLDAGCGDGRAARALDAMRRRVAYLGVDCSAALIELARERCAGLEGVQADFAVADLTKPGWARLVGSRRFGVVTCLAVLHHIPGQEARQRIVRDLAALLAPAGCLVVSTWQFMSSERWQKRIVPWATIGIDDADLEAGDYLLDWRRGGYGLRYCSMIAEDDLRALCVQAGLGVEDVARGDGGLNLFVTARRPS